MTIEDAGGHLREGLLTNSLPNDLPPNLSYRISSGVDGIFHSFIENEDCGDPPVSDVVLAPSEFVDISHGCGGGGFLTLKHPCGRTRTYHIPCNKRFACECPACSKRWARKNRRKFEALLLRMVSPKLLTLTLKKDRRTGHCPTLLDIHRMANALFHRLRYRGYRIDSWFAVVEFPNHLHVVLDSDFIHQDKISRLWSDVTDGSFVVDIRQINTARSGVRPTVKYVTKYLTKACGLTPAPEPSQLMIDVDDSVPIKRNFSLDELKGFHIVKSWGNEAICRQPLTCDCGDCSPWKKTDFCFVLPAVDDSFSILTTDKGPPVLVPSLIVLPSSSRICGPCSDCSKSLLECSLRDWPLHDGYGLSS